MVVDIVLHRSNMIDVMVESPFWSVTQDIERLDRDVQSLTRSMLPLLELGLNRYRISLRSGMWFEQGLFGRWIVVAEPGRRCYHKPLSHCSQVEKKREHSPLDIRLGSPLGQSSYSLLILTLQHKHSPSQNPH
jgi:hypothetical protein